MAAENPSLRGEQIAVAQIIMDQSQPHVEQQTQGNLRPRSFRATLQGLAEVEGYR
ncbi:hypothetical protein D3C76_1612800 [compost metagenome]